MLILRIIFIIIISFSFSLTLLAQQEARKIDSMGQLTCEEIKMNLDLLAIEMQNNPNDKAFIIFYGGRTSLRGKYNEKTRAYEIKKVKAKRNEAVVRLRNWDEYLIRKGIDKSRFEIINGGYREDFTVEFWLSPKESKPPQPTPTLTEKDIKFGKGKSKAYFFISDC